MRMWGAVCMRLSVCNHDVGPLSPFSINNEGFRKEKIVEVRDRVGGKGSRRRGSVIKGVWGQSSPSCLTRAGLSRGAGQRNAATFTLPYVFVPPPSGCSILSSLSLPRRGGGVRVSGAV